MYQFCTVATWKGSSLVPLKQRNTANTSVLPLLPGLTETAEGNAMCLSIHLWRHLLLINTTNHLQLISHTTNKSFCQQHRENRSEYRECEILELQQDPPQPRVLVTVTKNAVLSQTAAASTCFPQPVLVGGADNTQEGAFPLLYCYFIL